MTSKHLMIAIAFLTAGCSKYDSFAECMHGEIKGDSESALRVASAYCAELMNKYNAKGAEKVDAQGIGKIKVEMSVDDRNNFSFLIYNGNDFAIDNVTISLDKGDGIIVDHRIILSYVLPRNNKQADFNVIAGFTKSDATKKSFRWWVSSADKIEEN